MTRFQDNLYQVRSKSIDWIIIGSYDNKRSKNDSQNRLWSSMPEGVEPQWRAKGLNMVAKNWLRSPMHEGVEP